MMDLPTSSTCRHSECRHRAVRSGLCLVHLTALAGDGPLPWPADLEPRTWRERALIRRIGTA